MQPDFIIKGNPLSKKNSRPVYMRGGKPFIGKSARLIDAEKGALWQVKEQSHDISEPLPITYPLHIIYHFYREDRRRCDLSNLLEFPSDILQKAGIIENDCNIESLDGSRKFYDKENPRTEIFIEEYSDKDHPSVS